LQLGKSRFFTATDSAPVWYGPIRPLRPSRRQRRCRSRSSLPETLATLLPDGATCLALPQVDCRSLNCYRSYVRLPARLVPSCKSSRNHSLTVVARKSLPSRAPKQAVHVRQFLQVGTTGRPEVAVPPGTSLLPPSLPDRRGPPSKSKPERQSLRVSVGFPREFRRRPVPAGPPERSRRYRYAWNSECLLLLVLTCANLSLVLS